MDHFTPLSSSPSSSLPPSPYHLHLPETKACFARGANNSASSNVASGNSEISECGRRPGEGEGGCLGNQEMGI